MVGKKELLCIQCKAIRPHLAARGKSHGFFRFAAGTWDTFSSYGGNGHSNLEFLQQRQDSSLVTADNLGIETRLGMTIQTLLDLRLETKHSFLVGTVIF